MPYIDNKRRKILLADNPVKGAHSDPQTSVGVENKVLKDIITELGVNEKRLQQLIQQKRENDFLKDVITELGVDKKRLQKLIQQKKAEKEVVLPVSIFHTTSSALEVIVRYLHDVKRMRFVDIAAALNRNHCTIWLAYKRGAAKQTTANVLDSRIGSDIDSGIDSTIVSDITIPISIFSDRTYAPLEALAMHLKDSHNLSFSEIAVLLARSRKTIWTVYQRAKKKHAQ